MKQQDLCKLRESVSQRMTPKRYQHTLGVEKAAAELARVYGASEDQARRAALLHDVTKCLPLEEQLKLCRRWGIITQYDANAPELLHADTGAAVAREEFGEEEAVVEAIRNHTTGAPDMTLLDKIIYLADCIEENRDYDGVEEIRALCRKDLDDAMIFALKENLDHVIRRGKQPNTRSQQALDFYQAKKEKCL